MRWFILFWALPLALFWGWYFVSYNDLHMGYAMFTRDAHDQVFDIYSKLLAVLSHEYTGEMILIEPSEIPVFVAKATIIDSALLGAVLAFRRRKSIAAWLRQRGQIQGSGLPRTSSAPSA